MNEALKIVLSLSLSGSILILILHLLRPLFKDRLSKRWQYYIWLVVVARLLLPFAPETNLMGTLFQGIDKDMEQMEVVLSPSQDAPTVPEGGTHQSGVMENGQGDNLENGQPAPTAPADNTAQNILTVVLQNLWLGWLVVLLILLIRKITIYQGFVKYIRAGCVEVADIDLLERFGKLVDQNKVKTTVELYTNNLISSPLLIGFFRPCIVLPSTDLSPADFEYTIRHELTHFKRRDMFYKWLMQFTVCVHWFNPLVYLMSREVGRACELSCDEAVIKTLDPQGQRAYGDTLLNAMGVAGNYKNSVASVTLNEGKELLKERLDAIMRFKKKSKIIVCLTMILTLVICCGASYMGAYAASVPVSNELPTVDTTPKADDNNGNTTPSPVPSTDAFASNNNVKVSFTGVSITGQGPVGVELVRSQETDVTFELLQMDNEENCTVKADIVDGIMQITVNNYAPNGINVNFGPDYKNVVRVNIPDAIYTKFEIQSQNMVVQMQDFNAPVRVESNRAGFWLIDDIISQGTYDIDVTSGPIYIQAETFLKDITAHNESGPITVRFGKAPTDLYLDSTNCGPVVERPDDWPAIYKVGNETPKIILNNTGKAVIEVQSNDQ